MAGTGAGWLVPGFEAPVCRGTIPAPVGGNRPGSHRRAAEPWDGRHPGSAQFAGHAARYRARCERIGKAQGPVCPRHMPGGRTRPDGGRWQPSGTPGEQAEDIRAMPQRASTN